MSIYGTIPRPGDRVVVLTHAYPGTENDPVTAAALVPLTGGINRRIAQTMTLAGMMLVEGLVVSVATPAEAPRYNRETYLSHITIACDSPVAGRIGMLTSYYGYHSMLQAVSNIRNSPAFADLPDAQLHMLLKFCWPQVVASSEYVKLVRDVRGDSETPLSVRENIEQAQAVSASLGIRYVPFSLENLLHSQAGYPMSEDEQEQERELLVHLQQDFRQGQRPLSYGQTPTRVTLAAPSMPQVASWTSQVFISDDAEVALDYSTRTTTGPTSEEF